MQRQDPHKYTSSISNGQTSSGSNGVQTSSGSNGVQTSGGSNRQSSGGSHGQTQSGSSGWRSNVYSESSNDGSTGNGRAALQPKCSDKGEVCLLLSKFNPWSLVFHWIKGL